MYLFTLYVEVKSSASIGWGGTESLRGSLDYFGSLSGVSGDIGEEYLCVHFAAEFEEFWWASRVCVRLRNKGQRFEARRKNKEPRGFARGNSPTLIANVTHAGELTQRVFLVNRPDTEDQGVQLVTRPPITNLFKLFFQLKSIFIYGSIYFPYMGQSYVLYIMSHIFSCINFYMWNNKNTYM